MLSWEDWTGGLATTDRTAEPAPYGVGTVGARWAGEQGAPRFPLAIQRLDVRVHVDRDFAVTEVDEVFFNPSSEVVEGLYRFRTPEGAVLHRFGVDRDGAVMWGRVKEKQAAAAQYQANVYQGSTEDPALLEWDAPGVYRARLYPIGPGETRRVVVTYAEWLGRTGPKRDRRLYVYPMAAEGAEESLPHVEELYATIDLARAGASDVRAGMAAVREEDLLVVRDHDLVPRADLSVELFDDGLPIWRGYLAPHTVDTETLPPAERAEAMRRGRTEADYVLVPIPDGGAAGGGEGEGAGLDLAIVVDTSAATEPAALAVARAATGAILAHLGKNDRAVVWAGDATLRPVVPGKDKLAPFDEATRRAVLEHLATIERGGATDLGAMLADAAVSLSDGAPAAAGRGERRGAVVYVGDGAPTVGELSLADLQGHLAKLPRPVRIFGLGVGDTADMAILGGLSRGAFAERIGDANAAARAALRLLEVADRPARVGASVDLGPSVERVYPRDLGALIEGEGQVAVGRLVGPPPTSFTVKSAGGKVVEALQVSALDDHGDLSRRWAQGRLAQMIDEGVGRAAMVDLGVRHAIITPVTSLYVPTKNEMSPDERAELERRRSQGRGQHGARAYFTPTTGARDHEEVTEQSADNKEGGTGTRAKGEEGSMGNPNPRSGGGSASSTTTRYAVRGPADNAPSNAKYLEPPKPSPPVGSPPPAAPATLALGSTTLAGVPAKKEAGKGDVAGKDRAEALRDASAFGMIGLVNDKSSIDGVPSGGDMDGFIELPRAADDLRAGEAVSARGVMWGPEGKPGDSVAQGQALAKHEVEKPPPAQGFGSGHGKLGGKLERKLEEDKKVVAASPQVRTGKENEGVGGLEIRVRLGDVGHLALRCGGAAMVPFEERVGLWRERLAAGTGNAAFVASVYRRSLFACEAPTWRERSRLLSMLLDAMPSVQGKVALGRTMFGDLGAADTLYRGMLARVHTPVELRALHDALGLASIDPGVLAKTLKEAKTPGERVTKLRALVAVWNKDFALALKLLDALEDAGDDAGARELGRSLRARPDADARVRTAVGELYLRLSARAPPSPAQKALDESEARRAFGEIVEFAPEDPVARRRLGDLLRAHGWYVEATRQYETLARLSPDDTSVALLLAAAAEGMGKLEEAVKWTEKGGVSGAPEEGQGPAQTARALAATWLAWGRLEALGAGRADEAKALAARLARVRSTERLSGEAHKGTRVALTWTHPELHPTLWTNALGAPMPAPEGDVTMGIAAATVPVKDSAFVEVRLEPEDVEHAVRLGAEATLTVVFDEGGAGERIVRTKVRFASGDRATKRFGLAGGAVTEVTP